MPWTDQHTAAKARLIEWLKKVVWVDYDGDIRVVASRDRDEWSETEEDTIYVSPGDVVGVVLHDVERGAPAEEWLTPDEMRTISDALKASGEAALAVKVDQRRFA